MRHSVVYSTLLVLLLCCTFAGSAETSQQLSSNLRELVKLDPRSYSMWNITNKYNIYSDKNITGTCFREILLDRRITAAYMANLTLHRSIEFLHGHPRREFEKYGGSGLQTAPQMYRNRSTILKEQELYLSLIKDMENEYVETEKDLICSSRDQCGCFSRSVLKDYVFELSIFRESTDSLWEFIITGTYIDPSFRLLIGIVGFILNATLLFIFIKEKSVRTESNIMLFYLAVNNMLMLMIYLPTNYLLMYFVSDPDVENIYLGIQLFVVSANTLIILLLNVQRHFDVSRVLDMRSSRVTPTHRCAIYSAVLWGWSLGVSVFLIALAPDDAYTLEAILYFVIYLFVFSLVLALVISVTSRRLRHACQIGRTSSEFQHITEANVIVFITVSFYATHVPYFIYRLHELVVAEMGLTYFYVLAFKIIHYILHFIFFSYPCANIIVLYLASNVYKRLFRRYLFCCWYNTDASGNPVDVSLQNTNTGQ